MTPGAPAGIGLRAPHYREAWERRPPLALVEVHSENFFGDGGEPLAWLERFRGAYPVSLHGVGLSLGSADPLDETHLARLEGLVRRFQPRFVSEHLSWSSVGARHANDLLPLPFTPEALEHVVRHVAQVQQRLGRRILVENVSRYCDLPESSMPEAEFLAEVAKRSGCGLLLDVNNVWVNAANVGLDPRAYLAAIDPASVEEMHVAGFERADGLLIDTHGTRVDAQVWSLYRDAVQRFGAKPTIVEWDVDLPSLDVLLDEASKVAGG